MAVPLRNVFFRISINNVPSGIIEMKLFDEVAPKTCRNFRYLAAGVKVINDQPLHYKNNIFHRVIPGFMIQGGDITKNDGTGGISIYGREFPDETFKLKHDRPGLLSMANRGPGTNSSQFFITLAPANWLDGKHVVFGEIVRGKDVLNMMANVRTNDQDKPLQDIKIIECGIVNQ